MLNGHFSDIKQINLYDGYQLNCDDIDIVIRAVPDTDDHVERRLRSICS